MHKYRYRKILNQIHMPVCKPIYKTHNNSCGDCTPPRQEHVYFTPWAPNVSTRHFSSSECPLLFTLFTRDWKRERKLISPIVSIWRRRSWSLQSILRWGLEHHHPLFIFLPVWNFLFYIVFPWVYHDKNVGCCIYPDIRLFRTNPQKELNCLFTLLQE